MDSYCYVVSKDGEPGAFAVCADTPEHKKDTAKFVAAELRKGHIVNRVPTEDARKLLTAWFEFDKLRRHVSAVVVHRADVQTDGGAVVD